MTFTRDNLARLYYGLVLLLLLLRFKSHVLLSQLQHPVLTFVNTDYTYILIAFLGITKAVAQTSWLALLIDISLFASALASFILPRKRLGPIVFTIALGFYIVVGYTLLCFHKHNLVGLWMTSLMFLFTKEEGFDIMFDLTRYYCLFSYSTAGFWKFYRHVWRYSGHLPVILKNYGLAYIAEHPNGLHALTVSWFIMRPGWADGLMVMTAMAQLAYCLGFFTKKLDWFFLAFAIVFHLVALLLLRAYFLDFSVILITLLPRKQVR